MATVCGILGMSVAAGAYIYHKKGGVYMNNKPHDSMADRIAAYNEEMLRYYRQAHGYDPATQPVTAPAEAAAPEAAPAHPAATPEATSPTIQAMAPQETPSVPEKEIEIPPMEAPLPTERPWEEAAGCGGQEVPAPESGETSTSPSMPEPQPEESVPIEMVPPAEYEQSPFGGMSPSQPDGQPSSPRETDSSDTSDTAYLLVRVYSARGAIPLEGAVVTISQFTDSGEELLHLTVTDENGFTAKFPLPAASRELSQHPGNPHPFTFYNVQVDVDGYYTVRNENIPLYGGITSVQDVAMVPLPEQGQNEIQIFPEYGPTNLN